MSDEVLRVDNIRVVFATKYGTVHAVNNASFGIKGGEILGLVGESGCGKSVTALTILRLLPQTAKIVSGGVFFKGRNILELDDEGMRKIRGRNISMIFQDAQTSLDPMYSMGDQIGEAITVHSRIARDELNSRVVDLLRKVRLSAVQKEQYPHQLSGGMKQRGMAAIAISNEPSLIVADEPTTALDLTIQAQMVVLLKELREKYGISLLLITHNMGLVAQMCDTVAVMYCGYTVETADVFTLFKNPKHPYTQGLIETVPRLDTKVDKLRVIPGNLPDPMELPKHCVFQPRCWKAKEVCSEGIPALRDLGRSRVACFLADG